MPLLPLAGDGEQQLDQLEDRHRRQSHPEAESAAPLRQQSDGLLGRQIGDHVGRLVHQADLETQEVLEYKV